MQKSKTLKKKNKQISVTELIVNGQAKFDNGYWEDAAGIFRSVKSKIRQTILNTNRNQSISPHYKEAQEKLPRMLGEALPKCSINTLNYTERLKYIDEAIENVPDEHRYFNVRGLIHLIAGNIEAATVDIYKAKELAPSDNLVKRSLELFVIDLADALKELPESDPVALATIRFYQGVAEFNTGEKYQSSLNNFESAFKLLSLQNIELPFIKETTPYCYAIAEKVFDSDLELFIRSMRIIIFITNGKDGHAKSNLSHALTVKAQQLWNDNRFNEAISYLDEIVTLGYADQNVLRNLAIGYESIKNEALALETWRNLAKLMRDQFKQQLNDVVFKETFLNLEEHIVDLMITLNCPSHQIQSELEKAVNIDPLNVTLRKHVAKTLLQMDLPNQAIKHIEFYLKSSSSNDVDILLLKAEAFGQMNKFGQAGKILDNLLAISPSNELIRRSRLVLLDKQAREATEKRNFRQAIIFRENLLDIDPDNTNARIRLACNYFSLSEETQAVNHLNYCIENNPGNPLVKIEVAREYLNHGFKDDADKLAKQALKISSDPEILFEAGEIYIDNDDVKTALKHFNKAAKSDNFKVIINIIMSLQMAGLRKHSEKFLRIAEKLNPLSPEPYFLRVLAPFSTDNPMDLFAALIMRSELKGYLDKAEKLALANTEKYGEILSHIKDVKQMYNGILAFDDNFDPFA